MKIPVIEIPPSLPEGKEGYLTEPLGYGEQPFSSVRFKSEASQEDIQQVREWKNRLVQMRDKYKGTDMYITFDLELKRVVEFLFKFSE